MTVKRIKASMQESNRRERKEIKTPAGTCEAELRGKGVGSLIILLLTCCLTVLCSQCNNIDGQRGKEHEKLWYWAFWHLSL